MPAMSSRWGKILCCVFITAIAGSGFCGEESAVERFKNYGEYRPQPLWFWTGKADLHAIKKQMQDLKDVCGYGGVAIIPFFKDFKPEYLSEEYLELYKQTADYAKEIGFTLSLYDEYAFPSGNGGGNALADNIARFRKAFPLDTLKKLVHKRTEVKNGDTIIYKRKTDGILMALVAANFENVQTSNGKQSKPELDGFGKGEFECIALSERLKDGVLTWQVPQMGKWSILEFACISSDSENNVDYLSYEACKKFTKLVHDRYYEYMPEHFGSTIKTSFFDEPTLYRLDGAVWTPSFNEKFNAKYGYSPETLYPALFYGVGRNTASYRNLLFGFRADLYSGGFMKALNDWCEEHNIKLMGHQDNEEIVNCVGTSADFMKTFKYQRIAGIDKIGGARPAEDFYKLVSSAAYNYDRALVMSETFGAMPALPEELMYEIALDQYVKGINMLIPHAAWLEKNRVIFKPDLGAEDSYYAKRLKPFCNFLSRLNAVLQNEDRVWQNIAVYYPIETLQARHRFGGPLGSYEGGVNIKDANYHKVGKLLTDTLGRDFMYLHPEVFNERCTVEGNKILLNNKEQFNSFDLIIMPCVQTISEENYRKILQFAKNGGAVLFAGDKMPFLSSVSADENPRIEEISREIAKQKNVLILDEPYTNTVGAFIAAHAKSPVEFYGQNLKYIRKVKDGKSVYLVANLSGKMYDAKIRLTGKNFKVLNPHDGNISEAEITPKDPRQKESEDTCLISVKIPPAQGRIFAEY